MWLYGQPRRQGFSLKKMGVWYSEEVNATGESNQSDYSLLWMDNKT